MDVYFISGLTANCSVFDRIKLLDDYKKKYIEWIIPSGNETLGEYAESCKLGVQGLISHAALPQLGRDCGLYR